MKTKEQIKQVIAQIDALKEKASKVKNHEEGLYYLKAFGELDLSKQFLKWVIDDNFKFCVKSHYSNKNNEIMRLM